MTEGHLGVGLQLNVTTFPVVAGLEAARLPFDYLELVLDVVSGALDMPHLIEPNARQTLERLAATHRLLAHSNQGQEFGGGPLASTAAVRRHAPIARQLKSPFVANHMFVGMPSVSHLWSSPLQFSQREADRVAERAAALQDAFGMPLAHENAYLYAVMPGSDIPEAEFLARVVERAQTWLLLDLHNLHANSIAHPNDTQYDWRRFFRTVPLDRVLEIHVAGGQWLDGWYHDFHNHPVPEPVWEMLEHVLSRTRSVRAVTLEVQGAAHAARSRPMDASWTEMIRADLSRAKRIWDAHRAA